jgi:hypothetical protein
VTQGDAANPAPLRVAPLPMPPLATASAPTAPTAPLRVEITFEYTFDELREGLTQSPDIKSRKRMKPAAKLGSLFGWVLFVAMAMLLFLLLQKNSPPGRTPGIAGPLPPPGVDVMLTLAPSAFAAALVGIFAMTIAFFMVIQTSKSERVRRSGKYFGISAAIAYTLLIWFAISVLVSAPRPADMWAITRGQALMLSFAPWLVVVVVLLTFVVWFSRNHLRRMWTSRPYLRRRRTMIFDEGGERVLDEFTDLSYRWPYFRRAWETENCIVLQDENTIRHILPKRALDQPTLEALRAVISNHLADTKFLTTPGGFPVATAYAAPPALSVDPSRPTASQPL